MVEENAATKRVRKALAILKPGIEPFVATHMSKAYGANWLREASRTKGSSPTSALDTYGLLKTIRDRWKVTFSNEFDVVTGTKVRNFVHAAYDARNGLAHEAQFTDDEAQYYLFAIRQLAVLLDLSADILEQLTAINEEQKSVGIDAILSSSATLSAGASAPVDEQAASMPESPVAQMGDKPAEPPEASEPLIAPEEFAKPASMRRLLPLPAPSTEPGVAVVYFPLITHTGVIPPEEECVGSIRTSRVGRISADMRSTANGFDKNQYFKGLDGDVRYLEDDHDKSNELTHSRFDPLDFRGPSFGLAWAISDRMARYGVAAAHAGKRIMATGAILPKQGGAVGEIGGLREKLEIALNYLPAGSLFVFPSADHSKQEPHCQDLLDRLRAKSVEIRTAGHINDLNDLFAADEKPVPVAEQPSNGDEARQAKGSADPVSPTPFMVETPPATVRRQPVGIARIAVFSGLGAIVILGVILTMAMMRQDPIVDVAAVQASDDRLSALAKAMEAAGGSAEDAKACAALEQAAGRIKSFDTDRASSALLQALEVAKSCRTKLAERASRFQALLNASNEFDPVQGRFYVRLTAARDALTPFDLSQAPTEQQDAALRQADRAKAELSQSDVRLGKFREAFRTWSARDDDVAATLDVIDAHRDLQSFDIERLEGDDVSRVSRIEAIADRVAASRRKVGDAVVTIDAARALASREDRAHVLEALDGLTEFDMAFATRDERDALKVARAAIDQARWKSFQSALDAYRRSRGVEETAALLQAYDDLTEKDRRDHRSELDVAERLVTAAKREMAATSERLTSLEALARQVAEEEADNMVSAETYEKLIAAAGRLDHLDRSLLRDDQKTILEKVEQIREVLKASDRRIGRMSRFADRVRAAEDGRVDQAVFDKIKAIQRELTAFDRSRMTADQLEDLSIMCQAGLLTPLGQNPPDRRYTCFDLSRVKEVLKPAYKP